MYSSSGCQNIPLSFKWLKMGGVGSRWGWTAGLGMRFDSRSSNIWERQMWGARSRQNTKRQISTRGSIHGARTVTSCEKVDFAARFCAPGFGAALEEKEKTGDGWGGGCIHAHQHARAHAPQHTITYICQARRMPACKFLKRLSRRELGGAFRLARAVSRGSPSAPLPLRPRSLSPAHTHPRGQPRAPPAPPCSSGVGGGGRSRPGVIS